MIVQTNPDRRFELEKQLHEQYSSNSNAHLHIFLTFTATLFVLFGTFGVVFAKTIPSGIKDSPWFSIENFLWLSMVVMGILCFLTCLSVFLGYAERRDQLQLFRIRDKYGLKTVYSTPNNRRLAYYLTGYYRLFFTALLFSQILVIASSLYKISQFAYQCGCRCFWCDCPCYCRILCIVACFVYALCIVITICYVIKYYMNYLRTEGRPKEDCGQNCEIVRKQKKTDKKTKDFYVIISNGDFAICGKCIDGKYKINGPVCDDLDRKFDIKGNTISGVVIKPVSMFYFWWDKCWFPWLFGLLSTILSVFLIYGTIYIMGLVL